MFHASRRESRSPLHINDGMFLHSLGGCAQRAVPPWWDAHVFPMHPRRMSLVGTQAWRNKAREGAPTVELQVFAPTEIVSRNMRTIFCEHAVIVQNYTFSSCIISKEGALYVYSALSPWQLAFAEKASNFYIAHTTLGGQASSSNGAKPLIITRPVLWRCRYEHITKTGHSVHAASLSAVTSSCEQCWYQDALLGLSQRNPPRNFPYYVYLSGHLVNG